LYFADGSIEKKRKRSYEVSYSLQENEMEIASKSAALLRKSGLKPRVYVRTRKRSQIIFLQASSTNLNDFFPDKKRFLRSAEIRQRFFGSGGLLSDLRNRIAFCAGLLDGDGTCEARLDTSKIKNKEGSFGTLHAKWIFSQIKYPYLTDFFHQSISSLASGASSILRIRGRVRGVRINRLGRELLLEAGFAELSWKVRNFITSMTELLNEREQRRAEWAKSIKYMGVGLVDVAKILAVSRKTLENRHWRGKLQATLVREGGHRYLVIEPFQIEKLKQEFRKKMQP
jgi:hypothetical protein